MIIKCWEPDLTACSASAQIRWISFKKSVLELMSYVQSISVVYWLKWFLRVESSWLRRTGLSRSTKLHCSESSSTILPKFPKRVFKLITTCSLKLSMDGLVTWLKFCLKKLCSPRYLSVNTLKGASSPIEPVASRPVFTIGSKIKSNISRERLKDFACW